jgi:hypothetical protein
MIALSRARRARRRQRDRPQHPPRRPTIIFLLATVTLQPFAMPSDAEQPVVILVALLCA